MSVEQCSSEMTDNIPNACEKKLVEESETVKSRYSPLCRQLIACVGITAATVSSGMVLGYSAILLPELQRPDSLFKVDVEVSSSIASVALLPMAFGCLLAGFLMDRFGRKMTILIINVPFVIGWCIISMSKCVTWLLLGRILTGFCVGVLSPTGAIYLSEMTEPKYRGFFLATLTFDIALGILSTHFLAFYCTRDVNAIICGFLPFIGYIVTAFVPESPSWLLKRNRIYEACYAYRWTRGCDETAMKELESMVESHARANNSCEGENGNGNTINSGVIQSNDEVHNESNTNHHFHPIDHLRKLIALKSFNTPLIILSIYFATLQFSGVNAVIFYTVTILKDSLGANINEYVATLVIDVVRLISALIACVVVKNVGRRPLTIFSGFSTAICLFALSYYLNLSNDNSLKNNVSIPLGIFVLYTLVLSIGINPLAWILTGELYPLRFRAIGSTFVTFFNFLCFFTVVKTSPIYFSMYGGSRIFAIYGMLTSIGSIFLMTFLPETKNQSLQEIEDNYTVKRKHKMSRNKVQP